MDTADVTEGASGDGNGRAADRRAGPPRSAAHRAPPPGHDLRPRAAGPAGRADAAAPARLGRDRRPQLVPDVRAARASTSASIAPDLRGHAPGLRTRAASSASPTAPTTARRRSSSSTPARSSRSATRWAARSRSCCGAATATSSSGLVLCATSAGFIPNRRAPRVPVGDARRGRGGARSPRSRRAVPALPLGRTRAAATAGVGRGRDAPPRLAHDRRGRPLDQHVPRRPLDRRGRRADRGRLHDRRPRRCSPSYSSRSPTPSPARPCTPSPTGTSPAPTRASARRCSRACVDVADRIARRRPTSADRPRRTSAAASRRAHVRGTQPRTMPSQRVGVARARTRCARRSTTSSPMREPVVHERRTVRQRRRTARTSCMIEPVISITTIARADERRVELLTGIELAELRRRRAFGATTTRRSSAVQRLSRPRSARSCRPAGSTSREQHRDREQQARVDVDRLHELAAADDRRQRPGVQRRRRCTSRTRNSVAVHQCTIALDPVEPRDSARRPRRRGAHVTSARRRGRCSGRPSRRRRSRSAPSSRARPRR